MLDDDAPPTKRLKLQPTNRSFLNQQNINVNCVQVQPKPEVRKRKIPKRQPKVLQIVDLHPHVLMEVFDYLSVEDLCNLAETNIRMRHLARNAFRWKAINGLNLYQNRRLDYVLFKRVMDNFGGSIASITVSTSRQT